MFKKNFLYFSWGPSPLVHTLDTAEKSPTQSFNLLHQILIDKIPLHFFSPGWAVPVLSAFPYVVLIQKTVKHVFIRAFCWKVTIFHGGRQTWHNFIPVQKKKKSQNLKIVWKKRNLWAPYLISAVSQQQGKEALKSAARGTMESAAAHLESCLLVRTRDTPCQQFCSTPTSISYIWDNIVPLHGLFIAKTITYLKFTK